MTKRHIVIALLIAVLGVSFVVRPVEAQQADIPVMTDAHMQRIQQNCGDALRTIQQIHASDGPLRVNRGQLYESISNKLMAGMNGRLTAHKADASSLVKLTAQYDKILVEFRVNYKKYDDQMSSVLTINCRKQPVAFYDEVAKARALRKVVNTNVNDLNQLIRDYEKSFDAVRAQIKASDGKKGTS